MRRVALWCALALVCGSSYASDWPKYCANLAMTGVAPSSSEITKSTAKTLTMQWALRLNGPIASSPTVVKGRVYVGDWAGYEWSVDEITGKILATTDLGTTTALQCEPPVIGITSAAAVDNGRVFVAGGDNSFYALNADTLSIAWKQELGDNTNGYYGWCSPAVVGSSVLQGISSNCDAPFVRGDLVSLDRDGGTRSANAAFVDESTLGSGVWTSPAVDTATKTVFVTTASAQSMDDGYAYSIVSMKLDDLSILDSWKLPDVPEWADYDWGTSPTLFEDAEGRQLVGAGQKNGAYYAFDRRNLSAGPAWITYIAIGGPCPLCGEGILSTAAFDGKRLYVGSGQASSGYLGAVTALDPSDGHVIWQTPFAAAVIAPISYANGVLFTTTGKSLVALDADTGAVLGTYMTQGKCVGGVAITDRGVYFGDLSGTLYHIIAGEVPPRRRAVIAK